MSLQDLPINSLDSATLPLVGTENMAITQGGKTVKAPVSEVLKQTGNSGSFTPLFSNQANIANITNIISAMWTKVGKIVTVNYYLSITPTSSGVNTIVSLTLPIANTAQSVIAVGVYGDGVNYQASKIVANTANLVNLAFNPITNNQSEHSLSVTYKLP